MKTKKTMTDSWSCVPQLKEACNEIDTDVKWVTEDDDPIWNGPSEDLLPDDE